MLSALSNFVPGGINFTRNSNANDQQTQELHIPLPYRAILGLAGIGLSVISAIFTVNLMADLSNTPTEKTLMSGVGLCFEVAKFVIIPLGFSMLIKGRIRSLWPICIGLSLLAISIGASIGFLGSNADLSTAKAEQAQAVVNEASTSRNTLLTSIQSLEASIASERQNQAEFRSRGRISKASALTANIKELEAQKNSLLSQLNSQPSTLPSTTETPKTFSVSGSLFSSLATMFNTDKNTIKNRVHTSVAILLELVAITCLGMAGLKVSVGKGMPYDPEPLTIGGSDSNGSMISGKANKGSGKPSFSLVKNGYIPFRHTLLPKHVHHVHQVHPSNQEPEKNHYTGQNSVVNLAEFRANSTRVKSAPTCHVSHQEEPPTCHVVDEKQVRFNDAENAKVGDKIACPWCGDSFIKNRVNKRFCCPQHRDYYWNEIKPERKEAMKRRGRGLKTAVTA